MAPTGTTVEDRFEIRQRYHAGESAADLANEFSISLSRVYHIVTEGGNGGRRAPRLLRTTAARGSGRTGSRGPAFHQFIPRWPAPPKGSIALALVHGQGPRIEARRH